MFELMPCTFYLFFFFYKELIEKKLITKFRTTVITEGEKKGKVSHTYNYYSFQLYTLQSKNSYAIAEKWLILQIVN